MRRRKLSLMIVIILCFLPLTACWDYLDVEKRSMVISVGIDDKNGESTIIGGIGSVIGTSEDKGVKRYFFKGIGDDFADARLHIDSSLPFPLFLGTSRSIVFSESYASKSIEPYLNRIDQLYDYRKSVLLTISKDPIEEILDRDIEQDVSVGFLLENIMEQLTRNGKALYVTAGDALNRIPMKYTAYLIPYIGLKDDIIQYLGLCVMKDSKLVDIVKVEDTDGIIYLLNKKPRLTEYIEHPKDKNIRILYITTVSGKKIYTDLKKEQLQINVELNVDAELRGQTYILPISQSEKKLMEKQLSSKIKEDIQSIIERSIKEYNCDFFDFYEYFRIQHPKLYDELDWNLVYQNAKVDVSVKARIINKNMRDPNALGKK